MHDFYPSVNGRVSCIIPAFNEFNTIDDVVDKTLSQSCVYELIVVDDGSYDDTSRVLHSWTHKDSRMVFFCHALNLGKGAAIRTGLVHANAQSVLIQDADLEYSPKDYGRLFDCMSRCDAMIVYGSRFLNPETARGRLRWHTFGNRLLTWFANLVTGQLLTDEATCYKLFRRDVLERMNLQENGFGFCPEVTAKASRMGIKIHEVPISYHPRTKAEGKKIRLWHGLEALWCLVYYTWFDRSMEPGAPRKPPAALKEVVRPPVAPEPEAVPVK